MILARQISRARLRRRSRASDDRAMEADRRIDHLARRSRGVGFWAARSDLVDLFAESASMARETMLATTLARARRLLDTIPNGFPVPEVGLDPDGEVAFGWIRRDRTMVSVSIGPSGDPSYAAGLVDGTAHGFVRWTDRFPTALTDLLRRLYHPE